MKRLLIIQTAFIGDVILATSLLEAAHKLYPDYFIDFLVRKGNEGLFKNHPFIHELIIWDKKGRKYQSLWKCLMLIRRQKYTIVFNLQRFATSGFLAAFSGADTIIGFNKNPLSFLFSARVPHTINGNEHECLRNLKLLEPLGVEVGNFIAKPKLYPQIPALEIQRPYVCIAPASVWFTKQWPIEKWVSMIQLIPELYHVYMLGSSSDEELISVIIEKVEGRSCVTNLSGKLSLLESAGLMKDAHMNFVNDSAPMHLCSSVNAPVTAIFCSTIPEFGFGPLSDTSFIMQTLEPLSCRPCGLHGKARCPEGHFKCAYQIDAKVVVKSCS